MSISQNRHEWLFIESYSLGYLAHKLDTYSPKDPSTLDHDAMSDIQFVDLMKKNEIISNVGEVVCWEKRGAYHYYMIGYAMGYCDSQTGAPCKVSIPSRLQPTVKKWDNTVNIQREYPV